MKAKGKELRLSRIYDAPVTAVWDAWTDPEQLAKWWGPRGFTITTKSKDLRPGGNWIYTMHGPDGVDYPNHTVYHEVEPRTRLVYDHGGSEGTPPLFRVTVTFAEKQGKTTMEMTMTAPSAEAAKELAKFVKMANGNSTWDRLGEHLDEKVSGKDHFIINRVFETPIDTMFAMWTDPKHLAQWLPPAGFTMKFIESDIRSGGQSLYMMEGPNGMRMYGRAAYRTIEKPTRLVYTQQFCDERGKPARHPMSPTWPETMLTTVTFTKEGDSETRVTVLWEPFAATPAEVATFMQGRGSMTQGWTGSFDKLEAVLSAD